VLVNDSAVSTSSDNHVVDSDTTLNFLETKVAAAINSAFNPPAILNEYGNNGLGGATYLVECDASAPDHGYKIGGETLWINPIDLILESDGLPDGTCLSAIQDGGDGSTPFILGDTFLRNVLAVFDIGAEMMRFSSRMCYDS
jgi:hypothetical protein